MSLGIPLTSQNSDDFLELARSLLGAALRDLLQTGTFKPMGAQITFTGQLMLMRVDPNAGSFSQQDHLDGLVSALRGGVTRLHVRAAGLVEHIDVRSEDGLMSEEGVRVLVEHVDGEAASYIYPLLRDGPTPTLGEPIMMPSAAILFPVA